MCLNFVQEYIFDIELFYFRSGSRKVYFDDVYIPKRSKQGIGVHCMNTMYPIPLVGEFPNPPENEKKESVAALQHEKPERKEAYRHKSANPGKNRICTFLEKKRVCYNKTRKGLIGIPLRVP